MAAPRSGRHSRKRRKSRPTRPSQASAEAAAAAPAGPPEPAPRSAREAFRPPTRPRHGETNAQLKARFESQQRQRDSMLGAYGERPTSPFGGLPVSEFAIFVGAIATVYGFAASVPAALAVGLVIVTLGVAEFSAREHFTGYRSHTTLLAAIPAIAVGIALIALVGGSLGRGALLLVVVPVFGVSFWFLRKRFRLARQARIARPPGS